MQVIYFILKWAGLTALFLIIVGLVGWCIGWISFKLEQIKPVASFFRKSKTAFEKIVTVLMILGAICMGVGIILWIVKGTIMIISIIIAFFAKILD